MVVATVSDNYNHTHSLTAMRPDDNGSPIEDRANIVVGSTNIVDLVAHWPGTITQPGAVVNEDDEEEHDNLLVLVNDDDDDGDGILDSQREPGAGIVAEDDEIITVVLNYDGPNEGTITLRAWSSPHGPAVRVFDAAGQTVVSEQLMGPLTVDLENPEGPLAGITQGPVTLRIESFDPASTGLQLSYHDTDGHLQGSDRVAYRVLPGEIEGSFSFGSIRYCAPSFGLIRYCEPEKINGRFYVGGDVDAENPLHLLFSVSRFQKDTEGNVRPDAGLRIEKEDGTLVCQAVLLDNAVIEQLVNVWNTIIATLNQNTYSDIPLMDFDTFADTLAGKMRVSREHLLQNNYFLCNAVTDPGADYKVCYGLSAQTQLGSRPLTVVQVDVDADVDYDDNMDNDTLAEGNPPGLFIGLNDDNDDCQTDPDGIDNTNERVDGPDDVPDLTPLVIRKIHPSTPQGTVILKQTGPTIGPSLVGGRIRIFENDPDPEGNYPLLFAGNEAPYESEDLWSKLAEADLELLVEGVQEGEVVLTLIYETPADWGTFTATDELHLHVVRADLKIRATRGYSGYLSEQEEELVPGCVLHVNNDNDDVHIEAELGWDIETDCENERVDGDDDVLDLARITLSCPWDLLPRPPEPGEGEDPPAQNEIVRLEIVEGKDKIRIFRAVDGIYEPFLGRDLPSYELPSVSEHDLRDDLPPDETTITYLVEGVLPGVATIKFTCNGIGGTYEDTVRITVVDISCPDSIYQLELMHREWSIGFADEADFTAIIENWYIELPEDHEDLLFVLDPTDDANLTRLAEAGTATIGCKRYPFTRVLRALGRGGAFETFPLRIYAGSGDWSACLYTKEVSVIPLAMSQRVCAPSYGFTGENGVGFADSARTHAYGLFGHEGALQAKASENQLNGRTIDFQHAQFSWSSRPSASGEQLSVGVDRASVSFPDDSGPTVTLMGYRPGLSLVTAEATVDGDPEVLGEWEVDCDIPVPTIPHLDQYYLATTAATDSNFDEEQNQDLIKLPQLYVTGPNGAVLVRHEVRVFEAMARQQAFFAAQLIDRTESSDGLADSDVFRWDPGSEFALSLPNIEAIFTKLGAWGSQGSIFPCAPRLQLIRRAWSYHDPFNLDSGTNNSEELFQLKSSVRHAADSAALSELLKAVSISYNFEDYVALVNAEYEDLSWWETWKPQPGLHMYRAAEGFSATDDWFGQLIQSKLLSDFFTETIGGDPSLFSFASNGGVNWNLSHPYTLKVLQHMMYDRAALLHTVLGSIAGMFAAYEIQDSGYNSDIPNVLDMGYPPDLVGDFPATELKLRLVDTDSESVTRQFTVRVKVNADLSWRTEWFVRHHEHVEPLPEVYQYARLSGEDICNPAVNTYHVFERVGAFENERLYTPNSLDIGLVPVSSPDGFASEVQRLCIQELSYLHRTLGELPELQGWFALARGFAESGGEEDWCRALGLAVLWIASEFPGAVELSNALNPRDLLTNDIQTTKDRFLHGLVAGVELFPVLVPLAASAGGRYVLKATGLARGLAKGAVSRAGAAELAGSLQASRFAGVASAISDLKWASIETAIFVLDSLETPKRIEREILGDNMLSFALNIAIGVKLGVKASAVVPGRALRHRANRPLTRLASHVSRQADEAVEGLTTWQRNLVRTLKEADPDYWNKSRLRTLLDNACFLPGTPVVMGDGSLKPIEDVRMGDKVLSRHENCRGGPVPAEVTNVMARKTDHIRALKIRLNIPLSHSRSPRRTGAGGSADHSRGDRAGDEDGEDDDSDDDRVVEVQTTDEHPFWVTELGWTPACRVEPGYEVQTASGATGSVVANNRWRLATKRPVCNLTVSGTETYFVTRHAIWVHNTGEWPACLDRDTLILELTEAFPDQVWTDEKLCRWFAEEVVPVRQNLQKSTPGAYLRRDTSIDMRKCENPASYTVPAHIPRDKQWFWEERLDEHPEFFSAANGDRILGQRIAPRIDDQWVEHFPMHAEFNNGQVRLIHHHMERGTHATPLPEPVHLGFHGPVHPSL